MTSARPTLYLIDGHSQVFKAYHAIQNLSNSRGIPTNAVYGFLQILHRLMKTRKPEYLAVVFDSSGPTFRHEMYDAYKANRGEAPEDLSMQVNYIFQILEGMRLQTFKAQGYEADDIIATLARRAVDEGFDVQVVTADKDLFQLVNDNVKILRLAPESETEFDREAVFQKMGVYPEQVGDLLAMVGDTSDNIPGIPRIGMKTAATLLAKYGTLENVLKSTGELKGKQQEYIENGRDSALLSQRLVALDYGVPIDCDLHGCTLATPDTPALLALYRELEFRKLAEDLAGAEPEAEEAMFAARETAYRAITTEADLSQFCALIRERGFVAFDAETDSTQTIIAKLVGISLAVEPNSAVYIPIGHADALGSSDGGAQLSIDVVRQHLIPIFADETIEKFSHNLKFDWHVMRNHGMEVRGANFDTLLASYLINADRRNHGLKDLAADLLGVKMTRIEDLIGSGKNQITFDQIAIEPATQYAAADADMTLQLTNLLRPKVEEQNAHRLLEEIELPLVPVLMSMERTGVCIDVTQFRSLAVEMEENLTRLRNDLYKCCGMEFNVGSPKQVAQVLFEHIGLRPVKSKKTGYSTDISVLEELAGEHEAPRLLAEYRQFEKLKSTYIDVLPNLICPATGRIHTSYNQAVAATGRLSSSDPNLQNIPIRTEWGRKIRQGFVPSDRDKNVLFAADYSQIELRVLAHVTKDPALVEAYQEEQDIHSLTASKVYDVPIEMVTSEMRSVAKMVNFGVIYGMGAQGLSQRLRIPHATAKSFIEEYFKGYAGVRAWLDGTLEVARELGYVETVSGRRRYLSDIKSKNFNARNAAERVATNAPIQGTSADMIKIAMINIERELRARNLQTRMIMQVHDELVFDVPRTELEEVRELVHHEMVHALPLDVPVKVESGEGANWDEC